MCKSEQQTNKLTHHLFILIGIIAAGVIKKQLGVMQMMGQMEVEAKITGEKILTMGTMEVETWGAKIGVIKVTAVGLPGILVASIMSTGTITMVDEEFLDGALKLREVTEN